MSIVTVICLCHNQKEYVLDALESVLQQTHKPVQLIVVDDASTDGSKDVIAQFVAKHKEVVHIDLFENMGSCKAFNRALPFATGEYVIDLAADDVLLPTRIEIGLHDFSLASSKAGVHISDAELIDARGKHLSFHSDRFPHATIPQGDIYKEVIARYFICSPTMMFKKEVIDMLHGYDENLQFEDFDFWVRSSRLYEYLYSPKVLIKKRILRHSLMARQFKFRSSHQESTYLICKKILELNRNNQEQKALNKRIWYEIKVNLRLFNWELCYKYFLLSIRNNKTQYESTF